MFDILYDAAAEYQRLDNIIYKIILGRKCKSYVMMLHFPPESFFHLAGLQHLKDIVFPSNNKERIYKLIISGKSGIQNIKHSLFFEKYSIEERLANFCFLENMLDSNAVRYLIHSNRNRQYTKIYSDYLCEREIDPEILYLFVARQTASPRFTNECRGVSFFRKHKVDYTVGTARATTLLIEKYSKGDILEVYRNPAYKDI